MGRPRKYANDAEKQAAFRDRWPVLSFRTESTTAETIKKLAEMFDESETEVINSLIKFALLNRNWTTMGLFGKRLPRAPGAAGNAKRKDGTYREELPE